MGIPSSQHPNYPLFHCANRGWKEGSTVVFHFLPSNESEARMYISGLIAYLCATASPWYLDLFKPVARARSQGTTWDPTTKQINSVLDSNFTKTLQLDPIYDLTNSSAALLSSTTIQFDVPVNDGMSIGFYKDSDSISTFRSNARSALKKKKEKSSASTEKTGISTPTQSVTFAPVTYGKPGDTSVSRMSDTASKVAGLETHFKKMESQFTSSFARLEAIISGIGTASLHAISGSTGSSQTLMQSANPPALVNAGGFGDEAAGLGS
jgi:hypothetical protein